MLVPHGPETARQCALADAVDAVHAKYGLDFLRAGRAGIRAADPVGADPADPAA